MKFEKIWETTKKVVKSTEITSNYLEKMSKEGMNIIKNPYRILNPFVVGRGLLSGAKAAKKVYETLKK